MSARTTASVSIPAVAHPLDVVEAETLQPLHHEDPAGDQVGVGPGDDDGAWPVSSSTRGDVEHVLGLEPEVELLDDGLGEQLDEGRAG